LVLADIQPEMLAKAKTRIERARKRLSAPGMARVDFHLCDGKSFPFGDGEFDRLVLVSALGEVAEREHYLREFRRVLKPDGLVSVTELAGDPDRLSIAEINGLASSAGLTEAGRFPGRLNCTINLRP
jgi:ubiquinone/menaquinone biosynthesis C-methylase UbiE